VVGIVDQPGADAATKPGSGPSRGAGSRGTPPGGLNGSGRKEHVPPQLLQHLRGPLEPLVERPGRCLSCQNPSPLSTDHRVREQAPMLCPTSTVWPNARSLPLGLKVFSAPGASPSARPPAIGSGTPVGYI